MRYSNFIAYNDFQELVIDNVEQDIVVLFFSSEKDSQEHKDSNEYSSAFDMAVQRFGDHDIGTVILFVMDIYQEGIPEAAENVKVPSIVMFPATRKSELVTYHEKMTRVITFTFANFYIDSNYHDFRQGQC